MEPSGASIPRGQYFAIRLLDAADFRDFKIHWLFNGRRIPGAHKPELGFYYMRPRFDGEYKALLIKDQEILATNAVKLETLAPEAKAVMISTENEPDAESCFFDPLAPELPVPAEPKTALPEKKKKAFLQKALAKTKKSAA